MQLINPVMSDGRGYYKVVGDSEADAILSGVEIGFSKEMTD